MVSLCNHRYGLSIYGVTHILVLEHVWSTCLVCPLLSNGQLNFKADPQSEAPLPLEYHGDFEKGLYHGYGDMKWVSVSTHSYVHTWVFCGISVTSVATTGFVVMLSPSPMVACCEHCVTFLLFQLVVHDFFQSCAFMICIFSATQLLNVRTPCT